MIRSLALRRDRVALVAAMAGVASVVGALVSVIVRFSTFQSAPDSGWYAFASSSPRRYVDYLGSAPYSSTLTLHLDGGGVHPSWWPLVPLGVGVGLASGLLIGVLLGLAGFRLYRPGRVQPIVELTDIP